MALSKIIILAIVIGLFIMLIAFVTRRHPDEQAVIDVIHDLEDCIRFNDGWDTDERIIELELMGALLTPEQKQEVLEYFCEKGYNV